MKKNAILLAMVLCFSGGAFAGDKADIVPPPPVTAHVERTQVIPIDVKTTATADEPWWKTLLTSNAVLALLATVGAKFLAGVVKDHKEEAQRWEGVVMHAYLDAENQGALKNWSGKDKLAHGMLEFDTAFKQAFGTDPTAKDRADAKMDFARIAYDHDAPATDAGVPVAKGVAELLRATS